MSQGAAAKASRPARSKPRRFAVKILVGVVTTAICLTLLEWGVRRFFPFFDPHTILYIQMTTNGVALGQPMKTARLAQPSGDYDTLVRFNDDGFRDTKTLRQATAADWFAVGDSFTMGWGVDENQRFSNLLEEHLRGGGQPALRVFNLAIPENIVGYGRLLKYTESRGGKVSHLIIGICMENDLRDYHDGKSQWDLAENWEGPPAGKETIRTWCKHHLALYSALSFGLQKFPVTRRLLEKSGLKRSVDALNAEPVWDEAILKSSRDELVKLVAGRDAVVLIVPSRQLWQGDKRATEKRVHEDFVRLAREAGLKVCDLKAAFEKGGDPLSYYFQHDPHWTTNGHAAAARELFKAIHEAPLK